MPIRSFEQQRILDVIKANAPMTELQFFAEELTQWKTSLPRKEMLVGEAYYDGDQAIMHHTRKAIGDMGELIEVKNLPNNHILDNQFAKCVDQKTNYLLGKPITFTSDNKVYAKAVKTVLGRRFMRTLKKAGRGALLDAINWLYPYYADDGSFACRVFHGYEILPYWLDAEHTMLDCALRLYEVEQYDGKEKKIVEKVDIIKIDGITGYIFENEVLTPDPDAPKRSYISVEQNGKTESYNWERFPLIPIKYNADEIPLIRRTKQLQDALNQVLSDFTNNLQEDGRNTILVLHNYDGTDLGEFRRNLATYGVVKVRTVEGAPGDVDTLTVEVNAENYKLIADLLKKALIENARSYDAKDDRMAGNPNKMNIQSMYLDIDLDANDMETELQAAFEELLWFVQQHLANTGVGDFIGEDLEVIFNRDILINETEAINNCKNSKGIISDETIVAQHPWTADPAEELKKVKAEAEEAMTNDPLRAAFEATNGKTVGKNKGALDEE